MGVAARATEAGSSRAGRAVIHVPSWYVSLLLALAAYRCWRICAWDEITEPIRLRIVRYGKKDYRERLATFVQCPWCLGFWVAVVWWGAWLFWPHAVTVAAVPFAVSVAVGLLGRFDSE